MRTAVILALLGFGLGGLVVPSSASAQVYKYRKKDGRVIYTDNLGELPPQRRAYYRRKQEEAEAKAERARAAMTPEAQRAAELEAQRARIVAAELADAQRRKQLAAIDEAIRSFRAAEEQETNQLAYWQERKTAGESDLAKALDAYRAAQAEWSSLAIKPRFSLFPGQNARLIALEKQLPELEAAVDAANLYLTETLPEAARQAGLPRGWMR